MAKKAIDWKNGAVLEDHTRKKHKILREYFRYYLLTRCQHPRMDSFKLFVFDGFSGAGRYGCGSAGSPIIFVEVLDSAVKEINLIRLKKGLKSVFIECRLLLNDSDESVIQQLKENLSPILIRLNNENSSLKLIVEYHVDTFENTYSKTKEHLLVFKNAFFNLDQCGYSHVNTKIIKDIIRSWRSPEVILTFMITSLLTYLSPSKGVTNVHLEKGIKSKIDKILSDDNLLTKPEWLGEAEKILFSHLKSCAKFVSPFSINNPDGWRYWLMHFASNYRAREVYNDVLHENSESQAHFGRLGLDMLSYDSKEENSLYLFNENSREKSKESLHTDIPSRISNSGNRILISDFFEAAYSETPAHSDDIKEVIIENPDIEVITSKGGKRRVSGAIRPEDSMILKPQMRIFLPF